MIYNCKMFSIKPLFFVLFETVADTTVSGTHIQHIQARSHHVNDVGDSVTIVHRTRISRHDDDESNSSSTTIVHTDDRSASWGTST